MDTLLATLNGYLKSTSSLIASYAPQVWDATLHLVWINAVLHIGLLILFTVGTLVLWSWTFRKLLIASIQDCWDNAYPGAMCALLGIVLVIGSVVLISKWCDSLPYIISLIDPKLGVLYGIANKAGIL